MGDPLGIGPEVVVKALADPELRSQGRFIVYGLHDVLSAAADQAEINSYWWREPYEFGARVATGVLVADFDDLNYVATNGKREPDALAGQASFRFVEEAIRSLKDGRIDALVTAPICKQSWRLAGYRLPGHTELLAEHFAIRRVNMLFVAGNGLNAPGSEDKSPDPGIASPISNLKSQILRVALASAHVPLFELRNHFTIGLVHQPIDLLDAALREWFGIDRPHIGVLGLNPHAGESGLLGDEEQRIIEPAIAMARNTNIHVTGPLPPDTAFSPGVLQQFDGLVAMYHDQGLIPVKMLAFDRAVQITLGLPAIRTSPDHGTAFDIAGKNRASPSSMREAIKLAINLAKIRRSERVAPVSAG
jgi:4-phospho-D-threonate 3-dehydrogenase / 4-phospho-D-erythronate 3-dehydrogenase